MAEVNKNLQKNIQFVESRFADWGDIVAKKITVGNENAHQWDIYITYIDDMVDRDLIEGQVLRGLMVDIHLNNREEMTPSSLIENGVITADYTEENDIEKAIDEVLVGNTMVLVDGYNKAIIVSTKGFPSRGVNKPETEIAIQGPQDAFAESMRTNTVLIRRRIRDVNLKCRQLKVGKRTKTDVAIMFLQGVADENVVNQVEYRLKNIDANAILDSGYIEQYIQDNKMSPFPQMQLTERPDKVAAEILQGRVAIVVDNTPFVVLVPVVLSSFYQASEDYYQRWEIASFIRIIRYIAGFIAFSLPGLYIAVTLYNPSMLPMDLMLQLAGARMGVPVSTIVEVVVMELAFEALREAGIRLPAAIGSTLGVVGGIIIGQAAVDAGLVSPMVVIVIALTGICSFAIPAQPLVSAYRLIKYFVIAMSSIFGIYGFVLALLCCAIHLSGLESFGLPYIYPFGKRHSGIKQDFKDTIVRLPVQMQDKPVFSKDNGVL